MKPLLIEIGTEELPVGALPALARALFDGVVDGLARRGVAIDRDGAKPLYSPRRLAVLLPGVTERCTKRSPLPSVARPSCVHSTPALAAKPCRARVGWPSASRAMLA